MSHNDMSTRMNNLSYRNLNLLTNKVNCQQILAYAVKGICISIKASTVEISKLFLLHR